jgi:transposase InsO family protein
MNNVELAAHQSERPARPRLPTTPHVPGARCSRRGRTAVSSPDNAKCYTGHRFRDTLAELDAHHIRIPPYTPRWNGKIERFFQTLDTEWAHAHTWPDSTTRDRGLQSFLRFYNRRRPHSAANGQPPITRVHQVREQDT